MAGKKTSDRTVEEKLSILIASIERVYPVAPKLLWRSFLMGLFGALGATLGLSIALALLTFILSQLEVIPGLGELIRSVPIPQVFPTPSV